MNYGRYKDRSMTYLGKRCIFVVRHGAITFPCPKRRKEQHIVGL